MNDSEVATQVGNLVQMAFSLTTSLTCWQVTDTLRLNRRPFLLECLIQEKDDSLKDKAILGLFISFVLPTNPGQGRCGGGGGVLSPVYCHALSFTRGCSIIIGYNNL